MEFVNASHLPSRTSLHASQNLAKSVSALPHGQKDNAAKMKEN
jgi:hypothetical protein